MKLLVRILRDRLRAYRRFLAANLFVVFLLGPLILVGTWWVADHYVEAARGVLKVHLATSSSPGALGLGIAGLVTALSLPATRREVFPHKSEHRCLEALPVGEGVRFHVALLASWGHQAPAWIVLSAAFLALGAGAAPVGDQLVRGLVLAVALLPLALGQMVLVQVRLRFAGLRSLTALAAAVAAAAGTAAVAGALWPRWLLLPWWSSAAQVEALAAAALADKRPPVAVAGAAWWVATTLVLYPTAAWLFLTFRRRDLERAQSLTRPSRSGVGALLLGLGRALKPTVAGRFAAGSGDALGALLWRDFLQVGRRFSPAVYLAAAFSLLCLALTHLVLPGLPLAPTDRWRLMLVGSVLAVYCAVTLVPLVLKHQLPRLWIEKSTAVEPDALWRTKLGLGLGLAVVPTVAAALLLAVSDAAPEGGVVVGVLQFLAASVVVSSIVGLAAFEIAAQPVLGLVFASFVGLALAGLFIFYPVAWWMWAVFFGWAAGKLAERAPRQVYLTKVER